MFEIDEIRMDYHLLNGDGKNHITDNNNPNISFSLKSDRSGVTLRSASITVNGWKTETKDQLCNIYDGPEFDEFTEYEVEIEAIDDKGNKAGKNVKFRTGRLDLPWSAQWITDDSYQVQSPVSPKPLTFKKVLKIENDVKEVHIMASAMGIYDLYMDGERINDDYFAPGFTDYDHNLQYGYYIIADIKPGDHVFTAIVASGWATGRSTHISDTNKSKSLIMSDREKFLAELHYVIETGERRIIGTDESFMVSHDGPYEFADFYDGEVYNANFSEEKRNWRNASVTKLDGKPKLLARYGEKVTAHEVFEPLKKFVTDSGEYIYSFEQNISGILCLEIDGTEGQKIVIRHAEDIENGQLYVQNLRSAKQEIVYTCREGRQTYEPRFTYMGFQYISVSGITPDKIRIRAKAIYSDLEQLGDFSCSNEDLNKLQKNLVWSGRDNFVDIPTDCPQRDERQGWTGDIALYCRTAAFNFNTNRFLEKWLMDLKVEQGKLGSIPFVVPERKGITTSITTTCWGDSCILVPYSLYRSFGNLEILKKMYPTMKRFIMDIGRWATVGAVANKSRYILSLPFQFGDWCAPYGAMQDWLKKGPWIGTAYYYNSCRIMSEIAGILGKEKDVLKYKKSAEKIRDAYITHFTDGAGKLPESTEFQSGYVLPLYFGMVDGKQKATMARELLKLIRENGMHLSTGFTATPYILFALADSGYADEAYELLLQDTNPSWLYQVRHGATTMWEQWDIVQEDGTHKEGSMNHYSYGTVGDFFYRRICGLEAIENGYRRFKVQPLIGGGLTSASCSYKSGYGLIKAGWRFDGNQGILEVDVPVNCQCIVQLPDKKTEEIPSGHYEFKWIIENE